MTYQLIMILYWLALSTWFGGVLFVAMAAPIIFRTVRESKPVLPHILSVNLEGQHGTLLAGSIVGNLLHSLLRIEMVCACVILVSLIGQFLLIHPSDSERIALGLRVLLLIAASALVLYDWFAVWPLILKHRQEYVDHADEPDIANPAKDEFDRQHHRSVSLLSAVLFLLLGMILFSAPGKTTTIIQHETSTPAAK